MVATSTTQTNRHSHYTRSQNSSNPIFNFDDVKKVVIDKFGEDLPLKEATINHLKRNQNVTNSLDRRLFRNKNDLKTIVLAQANSYASYYKQRRNLLSAFKKKALQWYPHFASFIDDFVFTSLWRKGLKESVVKELSISKSSLESKIMPHIQTFYGESEENKIKVHEAIDSHVREILKTDFQISESQLNKHFTEFKRGQPQFYRLNALFDREEISQEIHNKFFKECVNSTMVAVNKMLPAASRNDPEILEALKSHFESNKCVSVEICTQNRNYTNSELLKKLQPYIKAFVKFYDGEETVGNTNIKDEIDLTIYEVIRKYLKAKKKFSDTKAKCAVNFMRRNNQIDSIYSPDLLFDEGNLENVLKDVLREYEPIYSE